MRAAVHCCAAPICFPAAVPAALPLPPCCLTPPPPLPFFLPPSLQGYIAAGIVEYQHFAEFQHPSGKPQLYAYDQ